MLESGKKGIEETTDRQGSKGRYFHQLGPLGRVGLVVAMSVCTGTPHPPKKYIYIYIYFSFFYINHQTYPYFSQFFFLINHASSLNL